RCLSDWSSDVCSSDLLLPQTTRGRGAWRGRLVALTPLLGCALFLAVSMPFAAGAILHADHYQGRTALQAFDPLFGLTCTGRTLEIGRASCRDRGYVAG